MQNYTCVGYFTKIKSQHTNIFDSLMQDGRTALYVASDCGNTEMVEVLLKGSADPNIQQKVMLTEYMNYYSGLVCLQYLEHSCIVGVVGLLGFGSVGYCRFSGS